MISNNRTSGSAQESSEHNLMQEHLRNSDDTLFAAARESGSGVALERDRGWYECVVTNLLRGQGLEADAIARDVAERANFISSLQQSESIFRAVFERVPTGIGILGLDGRPVKGNAMMRIALGYSEEELVSTSMAQLTPPEDWQKEMPLQEELISGKRDHYHMSKRLIRKDGRIRWVNVSVVLLRGYDGRPQYALGLSNDITELKESEERLRELSARVLRLQEDERRRIARDLHDSTSQLLTALSLNLGVLKQSKLKSDPEARRLISHCLQLAKESAQEVRSLSYLLHPPLLEDFGLCGALREYVRGFAGRSGIRVKLRIPRDVSAVRLPCEVESTLFRIVQESVANVRKHSKSNAVVISLKLHRGNLGLRITDNGCGIAPEILARIERGEAAGLGVGISGMLERVEQLRGGMKIRSAGTGTSVQVMLPVQ